MQTTTSLQITYMNWSKKCLEKDKDSNLIAKLLVLVSVRNASDIPRLSPLYDRGLVDLNIAYIVSGLSWNIEVRVFFLEGVSLGSSISSWLLPAFNSLFELIFFRVIVFFRPARPRLLYVYSFVFHFRSIGVSLALGLRGYVISGLYWTQSPGVR